MSPEQVQGEKDIDGRSDIYAMGGTPMMAIAIFGWPIDKLGPEVASEVVDGGRAACAEAGIPLAGGHSIDSPEPIFGLAVTGTVENRLLKQNNTAEAGCKLYLTKPIGIGILTTAQKQKKLKPEHERIAPETMCQMNKIGSALGGLECVKAMTDVTGFGLLGHLREMCEGSGVNAEIDYQAVPKLPHVEEYLAMGCSPGGAQRNFDSYGHKVGPVDEGKRQLLCDPQTSGGLLVAVAPNGEEEFLMVTREAGMDLHPIGRLEEYTSDPLITVK
jgi:selenide,water dikinase